MRRLLYEERERKDIKQEALMKITVFYADKEKMDRDERWECARGNCANPAKYEQVDSWEVPSFLLSDTDEETLEKIFQEYNIGSKAAGKRSMSVGDIVQMGSSLYLCDTVRWKELEEDQKALFLKYNK